MKLTTSKYLIYPLCSIILLALFSSIKHSQPVKQEELRKTEEKIPGSEKTNTSSMCSVTTWSATHSMSITSHPSYSCRTGYTHPDPIRGVNGISP